MLKMLNDNNFTHYYHIFATLLIQRVQKEM